VVEKYSDFSGGLILIGGLPRLKIFQKQFQCSPFQVGLPLDGFRLEFFSNEICKNHCPVSQSLDDMHASLPDLKYRPPFLLQWSHHSVTPGHRGD
jgi:hypothetical protein